MATVKPGNSITRIATAMPLLSEHSGAGQQLVARAGRSFGERGCRVSQRRLSLPSAPVPSPPLRASRQHGMSHTGGSASLGSDIDRRSALIGMGGLATAVSLPPLPATSATQQPSTSARAALLSAIASGNDAEVERLIEELVLQDPAQGEGATSPALGGMWQLVWSARAEAFSPLLKLPPPLRPRILPAAWGRSSQRDWGGEGGAAPDWWRPGPWPVVVVLNSGTCHGLGSCTGDISTVPVSLLPSRIPLSRPILMESTHHVDVTSFIPIHCVRICLFSSVPEMKYHCIYISTLYLHLIKLLRSLILRTPTPRPTHNTPLFPPQDDARTPRADTVAPDQCRLELAPRPGASKRLLVEAGSDAEFRSVNLRTAVEQAAPKNRYLQRYLETTGSPGDLRISTIESGDPVIVGAVFVHQRI